MTSIEKTGRTLDAAIDAALLELGVDRDCVEIDVLEAPSRGFLGIGSRDARILVTVKEKKSALAELDEIYAASRKSTQPQRAPQTQRPPNNQPPVQPTTNLQSPTTRPEQIDNGIDAVVEARAFIDELLIKMGVSEVSVDKFAGDDGYVRFNIKGKNLGVLIGKHGYNLEALQYLTNLVGNRDAGIKRRFILDIEGYRQRRSETLRRLAFGMAKKVRNSGKAAAFEPMSPHERKVIHAALQRDRYVTTHSEGDEPNRKIVVSPRTDRPQGDRPFNQNRSFAPRTPFKKSEEA